jgi:hypothetical protein
MHWYLILWCFGGCNMREGAPKVGNASDFRALSGSLSGGWLQFLEGSLDGWPVLDQITGLPCME